MPIVPFLRKRKSKAPSQFLVVDISALDVKCMAFEISPQDLESEEAQLKVVGVGRQNLALSSSVGVIDREAVEEALDLAIKKALYELENPISHVIFGVGGDMCLGLTTTAKASRPEEVPITKGDREAIYKKVMAAARAKAQMEFLQVTGDSSTKLKLISKSTLYTVLDGSPVKDFENPSGKSLEMAVFTAFVPEDYVEFLVGLAKKFKLKIKAIGSEMYTLSKVLAQSNMESTNYVLVDMGNDATNVGIVFGGSIVFTKSLPIGRLQLVGEIKRKLGMMFPEAEAMLRRYANGDLGESEGAIVSEAIQKVLGIWLGGVHLLFTEFSGVKTFAPKIYLVGAGFDIPDVRDLFVTEPWTKSIPFKAPPEFVRLSVDNFAEVVDSTGKVGSLEWTLPLSLSVIFLEENK